MNGGQMSDDVLKMATYNANSTRARLELVLILATHGFTVWIEEPTLERRLGREWANYAERVPRWFPRLRRTRNSTSGDSKSEGEE